WTSVEKTVKGCGLPLSRISNASRVRLVIIRPSFSVTVAYTATVFAPLLNVGCCDCWALVDDWAVCATRADARQSTARFFMDSWCGHMTAGLSAGMSMIA